MRMKFKTLLGFLAAGLALTLALPLAAQTYPSKPVRLIVPFPAGGATDILSRALSQELGKKLGQPIVIDNRPGAGGTIGAVAAAQAAPDGYTLLLATSSTHSIGPALNPKIPYNVESDFTPIVYVASSPQVILVPMNSPAKNLREFIDYAQKNPGRLNYASSGNGTISNLSTEVFNTQSGASLVHIPYRGTGLSIADLISGKVDVLFDSVVTGMPQVREGKLRALAVTSAERTLLAPDLPTVAELLPGFESVTWFGVYGPRGLPVSIVTRVNEAINAALAEPDLKGRFIRLGAEAMGGTPQAFADTVRAESAKWKKVIVERKITAD
jgi:tripartite-type tricarboxylate transporter receptor subunit TctC